MMKWRFSHWKLYRPPPHIHATQKEAAINTLNNLRISTRLTATFAMLVAAMLVIAVTGVFQMGMMWRNADEISTLWLPKSVSVNKMGSQLASYRMAELQFVMSTVDSESDELQKKMAKGLAAFQADSKAFGERITDDNERKLFDSFMADWAAYLKIHEQVVSLTKQFQADQGKRLLNTTAEKLFVKATATLDQLVDISQKGATDEGANMVTSYNTARVAMLVIAALGVGLAAVAATVLIRSITKPLSEAVQAIERVAGGDLSVAINATTKDEAGQLLTALNNMQHGLIEVVSKVRHGSESVSAASEEIASGNQDLSNRTEQQATDLEQTNAHMNRLSGAVAENAENARQANQLAQGASNLAVRGGEVVGQVVETMKGINDSSRKISDIISVIDGIAFQTNILALNAAVEAARAGEQGRGFAVVASEVRSLAGRSADAAKEIKSLINASVERVEHGSTQVGQAGQTMTELVEAIKKVASIMGEISESSREQAAGVQQLGASMSNMDQATLQNAAMVEEISAAANTLRHQATDLVEAVSVFKVGRGGYLALG
ncbi:methyl-accepting chemotaxis protein [Rhodoferax lacus]|uniref:Methyl-accepting chemotaxis protein n=1 Tax=Rhodoferax lacus TaxID=2184758 RepID=A0A3E1REX9_9BURK|nr:methyl-accepting chemotaxis protein [Rhodoferax lacus]RFO97771.1 methyl-accepting chemotaxis protein [Rhodoferax lacus]